MINVRQKERKKEREGKRERMNESNLNGRVFTRCKKVAKRKRDGGGECESELVDMLYVTAPKLNSVIRAIYKEGMLSMSEVQQRQETSKDIWQTMYGFPMIVAICFRLVSYGAAQLRDAIFKRLYGAKEKTAIILQLYGGTNAFS